MEPITLPTASLGLIKKFLQENRDLMYKYIVKSIKRGATAKADHVDLFRFGETKYVAACRASEFPVVLKQALKYFVETEMYEEAAACRDLLTEVVIEDIIRPIPTE